jgi:hypothetical protein
MAIRLFALVLLALSLQVAPAAAQDPSTTSTTITEVPDPHIIPEPNSGVEPHDAGDRGGALQLALLAGLVVAIGGAVLFVVRQSRRAREGSS